MAAPSPFELSSTQTALAVIVPTHLQPELDTIRSVHDKAYGKWQPHINILYPFVNPVHLATAVQILRNSLLEDQPESIQVRVDEVGIFRHRKNATVYLKPSTDSEDALNHLRRRITSALGRKFSEGTHDGQFRPHITVGQASLIGDAIEQLSLKANNTLSIVWQFSSLAVLRREPSGIMTVLEELQIAPGDPTIPNHVSVTRVEDQTQTNQSSNFEGWSACYSYDAASGWNQTLNKSNLGSAGMDSTVVSISSYNLMSEPSAPSFSDRFSLIIGAIFSQETPVNSLVRVLCLQEVDTESLPMLLSNPLVQKNYPHSTHSPSTTLFNHRNLITLSSVPFKQHVIDFPQRHKSALAIRITNSPLAIINVHLTSSLTDEAVVIKQQQMNQLAKFIAEDRAMVVHEVLLAGDFNVTTSSRTIEAALDQGHITAETAQTVETIIDMDLWGDAFLENTSAGEEDNIDIYPGEEGATFDRSSNPLAAIAEVKIDRSPQRYDRILFQKGAKISVEDFDRFGFPAPNGECGSDHYGVHARLSVGKPSISAEAMSTDAPGLPLEIEVVEDYTDLQPFIAPYLPEQEDRVRRQTVLDILHQTLAADENLADLVLAPLGSYAMDTYLAESDLDLLAIGSVAPSVFFDSAIKQLRGLAKEGPGHGDGFKTVQMVNSLVPIIDAVVSGIKVDLQYCQAIELLQAYHSFKPAPSLQNLVFDPNVIVALPPRAMRPLNTYRDTAYLLNTMPEVSSYRVAHRFLAIYLKRRGLYSAKFGYLGGIHLSLMLNRVTKILFRSKSTASAGGEGNSSTSPASIVRSFFTYYATFDWANDIVCDPILPIPVFESRTKRLNREPIVIKAIHSPTARPNVAGSCTRLSVQTISSEFRLARDMIALGRWEWCLRLSQESIRDFLDKHGAFVCITIDMWDVAEIGGDTIREMVGGLESKITGLLATLGRSESIQARVWPQRFRVPGVEGQDSAGLKGYYLVGVSAKQDSPSNDLDVDMKKLLEGKVILAAREFERVIRNSNRFDASHAWIGVEVVPRKKVSEMGLVIDIRDWATEAATFIASDSELNLAATDITKEAISNDTSPNAPSLNPKMRAKSKSKLRPAQDIISRIKWDPDLNIEDYAIGYEDRFAGVKELDLVKWKSEQTDLEFIPSHRIVWIRRKGDGGEKVWDRRMRFDGLFGSGIKMA